MYLICPTPLPSSASRSSSLFPPGMLFSHKSPTHPGELVTFHTSKPQTLHFNLFQHLYIPRLQPSAWRWELLLFPHIHTPCFIPLAILGVKHIQNAVHTPFDWRLCWINCWAPGKFESVLICIQEKIPFPFLPIEARSQHSTDSRWTPHDSSSRRIC